VSPSVLAEVFSPREKSLVAVVSTERQEMSWLVPTLGASVALMGLLAAYCRYKSPRPLEDLSTVSNAKVILSFK
jgi:membrane associated rhomboid family serine protease